MSVHLGETLIYGRTPDTARTVVTAARACGIPVTHIRSVDIGFIVPNKIADRINEDSQQTWSDEEAVI